MLDERRDYLQSMRFETAWNVARTMIEAYPLAGVLGTILAIGSALAADENASVAVIVTQFGAAIWSTFAGLTAAIGLMLLHSLMQAVVCTAVGESRRRPAGRQPSQTRVGLRRRSRRRRRRPMPASRSARGQSHRGDVLMAGRRSKWFPGDAVPADAADGPAADHRLCPVPRTSAKPPKRSRLTWRSSGRELLQQREFDQRQLDEAMRDRDDALTNSRMRVRAAEAALASLAATLGRGGRSDRTPWVWAAIRRRRTQSRSVEKLAAELADASPEAMARFLVSHAELLKRAEVWNLHAAAGRFDPVVRRHQRRVVPIATNGPGRPDARSRRCVVHGVQAVAANQGIGHRPDLVRSTEPSWGLSAADRARCQRR